jgi:hypothetical protein
VENDMEKYFPVMIIFLGVVGVVGRKSKWIAVPAVASGFVISILAVLGQLD